MSEPEQDRPLYVEVAEALGWTDLREVEVSPFGPQWMGMPPPEELRQVVTAIDHAERSVTFGRGPATVDRYDTDWSAGGPLIQRYELSVLKGKRGWYALPFDDVPWVSEYPDVQMLLDGHIGLYDPEPSPLRVVCVRIIALAEAGKLPR